MVDILTSWKFGFGIFWNIGFYDIDPYRPLLAIRFGWYVLV
jgi:hypothetical protein